MPDLKGPTRNRIVWGYLQRAREDAQRDAWRQAQEALRRAQEITIGPVVASTNGVFVIDSIGANTWSTNSITLPDSWVDPPTKPARTVNLKQLERRRAREKAARKARKRNR